MTHFTKTIGKVALVASLFASGAMLAATPANAQEEPDLTKILPIDKSYVPARTSWGAPDLRGTFPIDNIASLPMQRQPQHGDRFYLNSREIAQREAEAGRSDAAYAAEEEAGTIGMGHWVESDASGNRTSLLIEPADGQLPAFTPAAEATYRAGRSSWTPNTDFDWLSDFDTWDRCITRGFPASMFPFRYNNGIRVLQSPGQVIIQLEMIHDARVVKIVDKADIEGLRWPENVRTWMGQSLGYWEGNTLVIETTNIIDGGSESRDTYERGPSPLNMATFGVPPFNTIPTSKKAVVVETLTMTGENRIVYDLTYSDPEVFTAPWKARLDWTRDDGYQFFEYACHEGNVQPRNYITASRAERANATDEGAGEGGSK